MTDEEIKQLARALFLIPGAPQLLQKRIGSGITILVSTLMCYLLCLPLGLVVHYLSWADAKRWFDHHPPR